MSISHPLLLFGLLSASAAVRISFWEENLSVFFVFRFSAFRFPFSVFRLIGFCRRSNLGRWVFFIKESKGKKESAPSLLAFTSR